MNEASRWRFELARRIAEGYAANPKTEVIMVAGSTGRGMADRYSDLEIDVYYSAPPTEAERRAMAEASGGTLTVLDQDDDEWEEQMDFGGFHASTSTFLVETMERYLREVLDEHSTAPLPQMRLHSLLHAQTLIGDELVQQWRARASNYPPELTRAVLRENLLFDGFGYAEEMLAARDDIIVLYDIFSRIERQILGALLGLNCLYLPNPSFKSMDETVSSLTLAPPDLSARLKAAFRLPPPDGVSLLHALIEEVSTLVETHVPDLDTTPYRAKVSFRRGVWDTPPTF
jgi:hypothetical protein